MMVMIDHGDDEDNDEDDDERSALEDISRAKKEGSALEDLSRAKKGFGIRGFIAAKKIIIINPPLHQFLIIKPGTIIILMIPAGGQSDES